MPMLLKIMTSLMPLYSLWATFAIYPNVNWYPFKGLYLDLNRFQYVDTDVLPLRTFKTDSPFRFRFATKIYDKAFFKHKLFEIQPQNGLKIKDLRTNQAQLLPNTERTIATDKGVQNFLLVQDDGVLHIKNLLGNAGYVIYKYDENGQVLFKTQLPHTLIQVDGQVRINLTYMGYMAYTNRFLAFRSFYEGEPKTCWLDTQISAAMPPTNNRVKCAPQTAVGLIRNEADEAVQGWLAVSSRTVNGTEMYDLNASLDDGKSWVITLGINPVDSAETLVLGNTLYVATYNRLTSGAKLVALEANTGRKKWTADVLRLDIVGNDRYTNKVFLSLFEDKLILEGNETAGNYIQIFDKDSGRRRFGDTDKVNFVRPD